jgi:hypothetical protein
MVVGGDGRGARTCGGGAATSATRRVCDVDGTACAPSAPTIPRTAPALKPVTAIRPPAAL